MHIVPSVGGELAHSGQGGPKHFAIDRVEDDGQHDRTPLFDRVHQARAPFQLSFVAFGKWFRWAADLNPVCTENSIRRRRSKRTA